MLLHASATLLSRYPAYAYLITSYACKRRVGDIVRPRAWAVFRLMTSSNFIGSSTGPFGAEPCVEEREPSDVLPRVREALDEPSIGGVCG